MSNVTFRSSTGLTLELTPYDHHTTTWHNKSGIYGFAHRSQSGWFFHYVGQTNSFAERIPNHERWGEARKAGATHVLAAVVALQADRDKFEQIMIRELQPRLNHQLR